MEAKSPARDRERARSRSRSASRVGFAGDDSSSGSGGSNAKVDLTAGKSQFETTCAACHTLSEAGTHGTVGPNLDKLKPGGHYSAEHFAH